MGLDNRAFCWNGIVTTNQDAIKSFYAATIGWHAVEHEFPNGEKATMFVANEFPRAHLREPAHEHEPCAWTTYLRVEDVDASTAAAAENGGSVLMPPETIAPGRMSVVSAPSGAVLCLYHEADEESAENAPNDTGGIHWRELQSKNAAADLEWLVATFGFDVEEMPIPGGTYHILKTGDAPRGGVCPAFHPDVAGGWLNWVAVEDVDATLDSIEANGGRRVNDPSDWPGIGRMAVAADPTGATFGVITPAEA